VTWVYRSLGPRRAYHTLGGGRERRSRHAASSAAMQHFAERLGAAISFTHSLVRHAGRDLSYAALQRHGAHLPSYRISRRWLAVAAYSISVRAGDFLQHGGLRARRAATGQAALRHGRRRLPQSDSKLSARQLQRFFTATWRVGVRKPKHLHGKHAVATAIRLSL